MNRILLVLTSKDDWDLAEPNFGIATNTFYTIFNKTCKDNNLTLVRASVKWVDPSGKFLKYWKYDTDKWNKVEDTLAPDYIYDYTTSYTESLGKDYFLFSVLRKLSNIYPLLNNPGFTELMGDKINQLILFKEFLPITKIKLNHESLNVPEFKFVTKHPNGSSGKGITFNDKSSLKQGYECIIQEIIDGKDESGILKDYRFTFVDNQLIYGETRQAKGNNLMTNCAQGGFNKYFSPEEMDNDLVQFAKNISTKMHSFNHNVFTIDLLKEFKTGKIYLIETNTKPGFGLFDGNLQIEYDNNAVTATENYTNAIIKSLLTLSTN